MRKILGKTIDYIFEIRYFLIGLSLIVLVLTTNLPYIIYAPGGLDNLNDKYTISSQYKSKGSFNLLYVSSYRANVILYLASLILPNWDVVKYADIKYDNETIDDSYIRDDIYLEMANQNAIMMAFDKANYKYEITDYKYKVIYIYEKADTTLKIGDEIIKIDGIDIKKIESLSKYISNKNVGDTINLSVKRDKIIEATAKIIMHNDSKIMGISAPLVYTLVTNPKININFEDGSSGPSAGLMLSLSIYDALTKSDLTGGLKIAGTGTLEEDGSVGEIGEIDKKLISAVKGHADIFIAPNGDNYNDVLRIVKEKKYKIKVIGVSSFDDAVSALENIK